MAFGSFLDAGRALLLGNIQASNQLPPRGLLGRKSEAYGYTLEDGPGDQGLAEGEPVKSEQRLWPADD